MVDYKIVVSSSVEKSLKKIPKSDVLKVITAIRTLASNPYPVGCRKLSGQEDIYRIRQGTYRIIYEVRGKELLILILKVGHRKDIYR